MLNPIGLSLNPIGLSLNPIGLSLNPIGLSLNPIGLSFGAAIRSSGVLGPLEGAERNPSGGLCFPSEVLETWTRAMMPPAGHAARKPTRQRKPGMVTGGLPPFWKTTRGWF